MTTMNNQTRVEVSEESIDAAIGLVSKKLARKLKEKGRGSFLSSHEILGVVAEEYHELIESVRGDENTPVIGELGDIAVACLFGIASIREHWPKEKKDDG